MLIDLALLAIVCACNLSLGTLVLIRNRKVTYSKYFFFMSLFISAWTVANYLTNIHLSYVISTVANRGAYAAAIIALLFATLFTYNFPIKRKPKTWELLVLGPGAFITTILSCTSLIAGSVIIMDDMRPTFETGNLIVIFGLGFGSLLFLMIRNSVLNLRSAKLSNRQQSGLIMIGLSVTAIIGFMLNVVIPAFVQDWQTTRYGPLLSLVLTGTVGYAIIKHKLFDIRIVVARYLGYLFTLLILATVYGLVVATIAQYLLKIDLSVGAQFFFVLASAAVGLLFQPLKRLFDSLTKQIFYQDSYDPQALFDELNRLLVSSISVDYLMKQSANLLLEKIKPEFCVIAVRGSDDSQRLYGTDNKQLDNDKVQAIFGSALTKTKSVVVTDNLPPRLAHFTKTLQKQDTAVLVRLAQNVRRGEAALGYVALGVRKSGHPYNAEDIRALETIANVLVISIQNALHYEEIQNFNATLQQQVSVATRKLRSTNEKLKALDEAKDDFVSMASHQLRTPLTSIKGYTQMVLEGDAGEVNDTQRKLLEQSYLSSQRMVYLIADLLNVSRLKTGKFIISEQPVNIAELVQQEIGTLKETAASRSLELNYEMPASFPTLSLDETKTRQVIMNFIDNAIYYTPAGGHIKVAVIETAASVEFRVIDDGIGVPAAERPHLFTKFYRAGNARTARPDGTGLGLFMAKKVVIAQGGAIIFETEEGKGSTFGFVFSKTKAATAD